jgi:hypothetical protein
MAQYGFVILFSPRYPTPCGSDVAVSCINGFMAAKVSSSKVNDEKS